jgi:IS30 family transposase
MDLVGPLSLTDSKNRYLLTVIDYWTRWCEACPIPNKESKTVANAFMTQWVTQHGTPMSILTDQKKEFVKELFHECCILMDTWKMQTTSFHPRCNGLTE